jgi:chemotaxis protein methyltransferase CheR
VNPNFLQKASEGVFSEWSFRDSPLWLKENYFKQVDKNRFEIAPRIKEKVTFAYLNLAEDVYPCLTNNTNAMDLIFCRNVLMYFAADRTKQVARNFHRSLVDTGWLFVSPTETSSELFPQFSSVHFEGVIFYQKGEKALSASVIPFPMEMPNAFYDDDEDMAALSQPTMDIISALSPSASVTQLSAESQSVVTKPALYEEALVLFERGDYAEATKRLQDEFALVQSAESLTLLARICANLGELAEARSWLEKAISKDKLNTGLHYLRAVILQEQGATEEGAFALKRTLYLDPNFVLAHFALGNLALRQKNFKEADKHFTNVLGLLVDYQPNDVLPQSDGLAAGRLKEMVMSAMSMERAV